MVTRLVREDLVQFVPNRFVRLGSAVFVGALETPRGSYGEAQAAAASLQAHDGRR